MVAKGALRRLAQAQLEPTPENYARAYADEAGTPPPPAEPAATAAARAQGVAWASLIERIARHLERAGKQWTPARRKDSLQRVLSGSRSDANRLLQRLQALVTAWETDRAGDPAETSIEELQAAPHNPPDAAAQPAAPAAGALMSPSWPPVVDALQGALRVGLDASEPRAAALADELAALADAIATDGATAQHVAAVQALCDRVRRLFAHRHHLVDQLGALCRELAQGLTELAEDDSWARGQCESLQARLAGHDDSDDGNEPAGSRAVGLSVRSVRAATELLAETRQRQQQVRGERQAAQEAIKTLIQRMISEAGDLGDHAGRFQLAVGQHAHAIENADSLESLGDVVRAMLDDSRAVQSAVSATRERLQSDQARAQVLESRVRELEADLRRLSDEVATDALTQVANRRGLAQAFDTLVGSQARDQHAGLPVQLAVGLLDIDNFKKLNDSLGHAAGDVALKSLAAVVRERLRPVDHLARFGGEEFVVLLPATALPEAQQALTRLQRSLSAGLFMHEGKEVFVTFSAGVTSWRPGETLQAALERADEALYEAKRGGKNRTCTA
jgi:diguanylate cyclase